MAEGAHDKSIATVRRGQCILNCAHTPPASLPELSCQLLLEEGFDRIVPEQAGSPGTAYAPIGHSGFITCFLQHIKPLKPVLVYATAPFPHFHLIYP